MSGILILGASHSGVAAAAALRTGGYGDAITLLSHESVQPYHRPPLSKEGLIKDAYTPTPLRPESFYQNNRIDLKHGVRITDLNRAEKYLLSADGTRYPYEILILACGAEPRRLPLAVDPGNIAHYLRTHDDLIQLKGRLAGARSIAVIGGGLIGIEIAALAVQKGLHTTIVELGTRLMERTVSKSIGSYVLDRHEANGLKARFGVTVTAIGSHGDSGVDVVTLADGKTIEADLVVAAIGAVAHDTLARDAGLEVDNGVLCTHEGVSSDPAIRAIGDCAAWYDSVLGRHVRNEAVNPGQEQAKIVAAAILGADMPPRRLPRFWSHQAAIQIQMAGDVHAADMEAVLKAPVSGAFSVLGFKGGDLVAVQTINAPQQFGKLHEMIGMSSDALAVALDVEFPPPHHH